MPRFSLQQLLWFLSIMAAVLAVVAWVMRSADADMRAVEAERLRRGPPPVITPRLPTTSEGPEKIPRYYPQGY